MNDKNKNYAALAPVGGRFCSLVSIGVIAGGGSLINAAAA
jgi:hypothetical protein